MLLLVPKRYRQSFRSAKRFGNVLNSSARHLNFISYEYFETICLNLWEKDNAFEIRSFYCNTYALDHNDNLTPEMRI